MATAGESDKSVPISRNEVTSKNTDNAIGSQEKSRKHRT
jgi:hypothetical protein